MTAGPVIRLWRRARRQRALPEADRIAAALELTGFRWLTSGRETADRPACENLECCWTSAALPKATRLMRH